jgi:hypothetical protein
MFELIRLYRYFRYHGRSRWRALRAAWRIVIA